jgi:hypothetical protein
LGNTLAFDVCENSDGFVKDDFFNENRLNRISPQSWILFQQTQRLFVDASTTNRTQKSFFEIR